MTLECRVKQKLDESETGYYLIAEIVNILCDEQYLDEDGKPDVESRWRKRAKRSSGLSFYLY